MTGLNGDREAVEKLVDAALASLEANRARIDDLNVYPVPDGDRVWEIDEFLDRELVLAEVELEGEDEDVTPPDWLRPFVVREVTGEPEYVNVNLAK